MALCSHRRYKIFIGILLTCLVCVALLQLSLAYNPVLYSNVRVIASDIRFRLSRSSWPWSSACQFLTTLPLAFLTSNSSVNIAGELTKGNCYFIDGDDNIGEWKVVVRALPREYPRRPYLRPGKAFHGRQRILQHSHYGYHGVNDTSALTDERLLSSDRVVEVIAQAGVSTAARLFTASLPLQQVCGATPATEACYIDYYMVLLHMEHGSSHMTEVARTSDAVLRIPASSARDLQLAIISDSQSGAPVFRRLLTIMSQKMPRIDMLVHVGDSMQARLDDRESFMYFQSPLIDMFSALGIVIPCVFIQGNHDDPFRYYAYNLDKSFFAFTWGPLRLVALNTEFSFDGQVTWLQNYCNTATQHDPQGIAANVVLMHVAPYVEYWEKEAWLAGQRFWSNYSRYSLLPAVKQCNFSSGATAIISGHSHIYHRGYDADLRASLIVVGGGGGVLEEPGTGRQEDSGKYSVTSIMHHFATLKLEAPDKNGLHSAAEWRVISEHGADMDRAMLIP